MASDLMNPGCPGPSYQDIVLSDEVQAPGGGVPDVLLPQRNVELSNRDISFDRYISDQFVELESAKLWPKVWQFVCRAEELSNEGDYYVYDIAEHSLIIVRTNDGLRAYHNSCLHRGTKLKPSGSSGWTGEAIQCPFHGWAWDLDGTLQEVPCSWEFEHLNYEANSLPEAQVDVWNSCVFINMDLCAEPLEEYLGVMPEHFKNWWSYDEWYTKIHVRKILSCNWKTAQEAFMEAYHTPVVHPEMTQTVGDWNMQHDIFNDHVSRDLCAMAVSSPSKDHGLTEQEKLKGRLRRFAHGSEVEVPKELTARDVLAREMRREFEQEYDKDLSHLSNAELIDSLKYNLFPNVFVYGGPGLPQIHVVRPIGKNQNECSFDVYFLSPLPKGEQRPETAEMVQITESDSYTQVPGMKKGSGEVLDQDTQILRWQHEGMLASKKGAETLSSYQESRIRHFHAVLEKYLGLS